MHKLFMLLTRTMQRELEACGLSVIQDFGFETIVSNNSMQASGLVAYVKGEKQAFRKLLDITGEIWTTTSPMMGEWKLMEKKALES